MAIVAVNLKDYPFLLSSIKEDIGYLPKDAHITILYLGEGAWSPQVIEALIHACSQTKEPIAANISYIGHFENRPNYPIILPVESPALHAFRACIIEYLDKRNVPYPKDWANFSPHITLSYSDERPQRRSITPKTVIINSVELWLDSDGDKNKLVFSIGSTSDTCAKLVESIHTVNKGITCMDESSKKLQALSAKLKLQKALTANIVSGWAKRAKLEEYATQPVEGTEYGYTITHSGSLSGTPVVDPTLVEPNKPHSSFRLNESTPPVVSIQKSLEATIPCLACGYIYKSVHPLCPRCDRTQESKEIWNR